MSIPKIYLETTIFNFYFAEKGRQYFGKTVEYCQDTKRFFNAIKTGKFEPFTSEYVIEEIKLEKNEEHRQEMLKLIDDWDIIILPEREEIKRLANQYIEAGAIPKNMLDDARQTHESPK
jgi:hypothetical protein